MKEWLASGMTYWLTSNHIYWLRGVDIYDSDAGDPPIWPTIHSYQEGILRGLIDSILTMELTLLQTSWKGRLTRETTATKRSKTSVLSVTRLLLAANENGDGNKPLQIIYTIIRPRWSKCCRVSTTSKLRPTLYRPSSDLVIIIDQCTYVSAFSTYLDRN